ncbi:SDR family oxidoreductase [Hamadaea sp.]|uniref:SDR family oxidoreductase n=1 Tax=Hamadaea sp. TaxID=2024425 RepID=UPI0025C50C9B|nr:SDR family oxidoreductase [Hamadaea sp.]
MTTILVTGGTGTLGRQVVPLLRETGAKVRVLSRQARTGDEGVEYAVADLLTGEGVEAAVDGAEIVVHLAGGQKGDDVATRTLAAAARKFGVRHLVYISVIGVGRVPLGWLRMKEAAEQAIEDSGVPWTTLRAAQFHDLVLKTLQGMTKSPVVPVPGGMRFQPVDTHDVAVRLVELALGEPAGLVPDLAGPQVYEMRDLITGYLRATGKRRLLLPIRVPGAAGKAYRDGANLTVTGADLGTRTWEQFAATAA